MTIDVTAERGGAVQTWWLNRPDVRNALSLSMWRALSDLAQRVRRDRTVRVVIIRGRGGHFSAGADINGLGLDLAADTETSTYRQINSAAEDAVASLPCPVIAAIDGYCVGGGAQLAMACDLRIASRDCRIAITPAKLGIAYPARSIQRLVALVGSGLATELLLMGTQIDAERALSSGFLNAVTNDLDSAVDDAVTTLLSRSAFSQYASKSVINEMVINLDLSELNTRFERASLASRDVHEGLDAFANKRLPLFGPRDFDA